LFVRQSGAVVVLKNGGSVYFEGSFVENRFQACVGTRERIVLEDLDNNPGVKNISFCET
jgi:hypothetical protein